MSERTTVYKVFRDLGNGILQSITPEAWGEPTEGKRERMPSKFILTYKRGGFYKKHWPYFAYDSEFEAQECVDRLSLQFPDGKYLFMKCSAKYTYHCPRGISLRDVSGVVTPIWTVLGSDLTLEVISGFAYPGNLNRCVACSDLKIS